MHGQPSRVHIRRLILTLTLQRFLAMAKGRYINVLTNNNNNNNNNNNTTEKRHLVVCTDSRVCINTAKWSMTGIGKRQICGFADVATGKRRMWMRRKSAFYPSYAAMPIA